MLAIAGAYMRILGMMGWWAPWLHWAAQMLPRQKDLEAKQKDLQAGTVSVQDRKRRFPAREAERRLQEDFLHIPYCQPGDCMHTRCEYLSLVVVASMVVLASCYTGSLHFKSVVAGLRAKPTAKAFILRVIWYERIICFACRLEEGGTEQAPCQVLWSHLEDINDAQNG